MKQLPINRDGNYIHVNDINNPHCLKAFTASIKQVVKRGYQDLIVDINTSGALYPNTLVPLCGILDYYRNDGICISVKYDGKDYEKNYISFYDPLLDIVELSRPLSKIWRFSDTQGICDIQKSIISELRKEEVFADGILEGIEWSINEIMDNVLNHSEAKAGYIMGQLHKSSKHIAFTIFDYGRGIYNSFKESKHHVRSNADALSFCLQEGVTRDPKVGQGNGMCGLFSLIKEGNGILQISSGLDTYSYKNGIAQTTDDHICSISGKLGCTTVDFQLDYSKDISIDKVLTFQGRTFTFVNLFTDDLEDENGILHFSVNDLAEGTGTRESAKRFKNQIINSIKSQNRVAVIDFEGINVVSSSFIDELIAKLLIELGLFQFNRRISLKNMSLLLQKTLQKSVIQRIIEDYSESEI